MLKTQFFFFQLAFVCCFTSLLSAQNIVDIYFIAGQSNAGNFGEINSNDVQGYNGYNAADFDNQSDAGFDLTFARIRDRTSGGPVTEVVEAFSSNLLDPTNYAVDNFAVQVNQTFGNDVGIFSYGRNGRPLENADDDLVINGQRNDGGESWDPNVTGELYDAFITWSSDRVAEIESTGDVANVQGILWFQGEEDAANDTDDTYQANFEDLVGRFRQDFNNTELVIVASEIREVGSDLANTQNINDALNLVAANDAFVQVIDINSDTNTYSGVSASDVHLDAAGQIALSNDFANSIIALNAGTTAVPEPSSLALLGIGAIGFMTRRRR